jgi:hypothetical protein
MFNQEVCSYIWSEILTLIVPARALSNFMYKLWGTQQNVPRTLLLRHCLFAAITSEQSLICACSFSHLCTVRFPFKSIVQLGDNWGRDEEEIALLSEFDNGSGNGSPSDDHDEYPQRTEKQKQERREWESDTLQRILSDQAGNGEDLPQAPDHSRHTPPGAAAAAGTSGTGPPAVTSSSGNSGNSTTAAHRHGAAMPGFVGVGRRNEAVALPHVAQPWQPRPQNPASAAASQRLQQQPQPPPSRGAVPEPAEPWPLPHQQPQTHQRPPWGYTDPQGGGGAPPPPSVGAPPQQQQPWGGGFYDRFGIPMADVPAMPNPNPTVSGYAPRESSSSASSSATAHGMLGMPHAQQPINPGAPMMPGHLQQQALPTPAAAEAMAAYQAHMSGTSSSGAGGGGGGGMFSFPSGSLSGSGGGGGHSGELLGDNNESLLGDNDEWEGDEEGGTFEKDAGSGRESGGAVKKRKGANVSKADKDKANRDRNREHARNTRLRKKAYVAKLSQLVMDLSSQREALARDRAMQVWTQIPVFRVSLFLACFLFSPLFLFLPVFSISPYLVDFFCVLILCLLPVHTPFHFRDLHHDTRPLWSESSTA